VSVKRSWLVVAAVLGGLGLLGLAAALMGIPAPGFSHRPGQTHTLEELEARFVGREAGEFRAALGPAHLEEGPQVLYPDLVRTPEGVRHAVFVVALYRVPDGREVLLVDRVVVKDDDYLWRYWRVGRGGR
jgi:hypothetical protein